MRLRLTYRHQNTLVFCSQSLNCLKISKLGLATNKQFKSDSARLAFLVWVEFGVYGGQVECRGRVLHTLIGRYVLR
ncbi:hypothetical protein E5J32_23470, partial [Vibrio parahaemolyticus]|nr:hypothetical protein [Vibrio parahaemolyticus]